MIIFHGNDRWPRLFYFKTLSIRSLWWVHRPHGETIRLRLRVPPLVGLLKVSCWRYGADGAEIKGGGDRFSYNEVML